MRRSSVSFERWRVAEQEVRTLEALMAQRPSAAPHYRVELTALRTLASSFLRSYLVDAEVDANAEQQTGANAAAVSDLARRRLEEAEHADDRPSPDAT